MSEKDWKEELKWKHEAFERFQAEYFKDTGSYIQNHECHIFMAGIEAAEKHYEDGGLAGLGYVQIQKDKIKDLEAKLAIALFSLQEIRRHTDEPLTVDELCRMALADIGTLEDKQ